MRRTLSVGLLVLAAAGCADARSGDGQPEDARVAEGLAAEDARVAEGQPGRGDSPRDDATSRAVATADAGESKYLADIHQVTAGFHRAGEGYFSPDGHRIVYQAYPPGYPFYQIYVQELSGRDPRRISPGRGRATCAYFSPDAGTILFGSAHTRPDLGRAEREARALAAEGGRRRYEWMFDEYMDIYVVEFDGTNRTRLTDAPGYDAEGSYSHDGEHIVFTSTRDGDPDLYIMDTDGSNLRQLTDAAGYDGGPFFSPDDSWVIFRSDREREDMLQIYAISADGEHTVQLTHDLDRVSWAPYFHPSGDYIVWTMADYSRGPYEANFDLFTMEIEYDEDSFEGGTVTRITFDEAADILPVFSPDGTRLMWTSTRAEDGSSQLWIADWLRER